MADNASRLKNFPIAWFSMVMGMAGFSIAWNRAEHVLDTGFCLSPVLLAFTTLLFVGMLLLLAAGLLGALSVLVLLLLARTALAVMRREICVEGH